MAVERHEEEQRQQGVAGAEDARLRPARRVEELPCAEADLQVEDLPGQAQRLKDRRRDEAQRDAEEQLRDAEPDVLQRLPVAGGAPATGAITTARLSARASRTCAGACW